ncbi:MAG: DMT family transporter [Gammaproteobacteria bacterium]|nr:DMT family transporter [Gammaproteobacteria bacterium]
MNNTISYSLIMLLAGLGIPVMAALNGGLAIKLNSPALAATILFSVGLVVAVIYLIFTEGIPSMLYVENTPWYFYGGGFFVMFYILSISWVAPRFGIANAVAFVLLGQLIAMSLIEHFGLIGAPRYTLSTQRIVGLVFMVIGVFLALNKK